MKQTLLNWLEEIGREVFDPQAVSPDGTFKVRTNDEQLARLVWKRALGYENNVKLDNGQFSQNKEPPDSKAQQFIFERREGKFTAAAEGTSTTTLDRISEVIKDRLNDIAQEIVDNGNNDSDNKSSS